MMIFFNQGMLLLGSNHFLKKVIVWQSCQNKMDEFNYFLWYFNNIFISIICILKESEE